MNQNSIIENLVQIYAIAEKNVKLSLRFKFRLIMSLITPMITIVMPLIVMSKFLSFNADFGAWDSTNFMIYQFVAYNINISIGIRDAYSGNFSTEKVWKTFQALIIAPFNRLNLLFGIFLTHIILTSIPFTFFFVLNYIYYPISIFTVIFMLFLYFLITLLFSGIGITVGVFTVSKEGIKPYISFVIGLFFLFSCASFPFQLFPPEFQLIINLNPLYYIFDIMRLAWIEDNLIYTLNQHLLNFYMLLIGAIVFPIMGVFIFNAIYKKYGIVGY